MWKRPTGYFKKKARLIGKLSRKQIGRLYGYGLSAQEIAKVDGTAKPSILSVLKMLGIKRRPPRRKKIHGAVFEAAKFGVSGQTYLRFLIIRKLGAACSVCGNTDVRVLAINHLKDKKRKLSMGELTLIWLGKKQDVDIRCHNCNALYEYERGKFVNHQGMIKQIFNEPKCSDA
jgi:hypothetical protein